MWDSSFHQIGLKFLLLAIWEWSSSGDLSWWSWCWWSWWQLWRRSSWWYWFVQKQPCKKTTIISLKDERWKPNDREAAKEAQLKVRISINQIFLDILSLCTKVKCCCHYSALILHVQRKDARGPLYDQGTICHQVRLAITLNINYLFKLSYEI